jgi:hypothetical protein
VPNWDKLNEELDDALENMSSDDWKKLKNKNMKYRIYLDDVRTPLSPNNAWVDGIEEWTVVRSYDEFVQKVNAVVLDHIDLISLDHDLGDSAMREWHYGVVKNYTINYDNITEKTGYDCAKWLVNQWLDGKTVVKVVTHSANAVGSANIMGYINNYLHLHKLPQDCIRVQIEHTV